MNRFKASAQRARASAMVIPIFLIFAALFVISLGNFIEDYNTSRLGYVALPTKKYGAYIPYMVALFPQVGQMGLFYYWGYEGSRMELLASFGLFAVDTSLDMVFKIAGDLSLVPLAFVETVALYTIGSEVCLTISVGMLMELLPDFIGQLKILWDRIVDALEGGGSSGGSNGRTINPSTLGDDVYGDYEGSGRRKTRAGRS